MGGITEEPSTTAFIGNQTSPPFNASSQPFTAGEPPRQPMSFKEKLMSTEQQMPEEEDLILEAGDVEVTTEGPFPAINFSRRVHALLEASMKYAVVLKLLGRPIGYGRLRDQLAKIWKFAGAFRLTDLEGGCFIANFTNAQDFSTVLTEGPWVVAGHYLTIHP